MERIQVVEHNLKILRKKKRKMVNRRLDLIRNGGQPVKLSNLQGKLKDLNKEISTLIREDRELKGLPIPQAVRVGMKSAKMSGRLRS